MDRLWTVERQCEVQPGGSQWHFDAIDEWTQDVRRAFHQEDAALLLLLLRRTSHPRLACGPQTAQHGVSAQGAGVRRALDVGHPWTGSWCRGIC